MFLPNSTFVFGFLRRPRALPQTAPPVLESGAQWQWLADAVYPHYRVSHPLGWRGDRALLLLLDAKERRFVACCREVSCEESRRRAEREFAAQDRLAHPGILPVLHSQVLDAHAFTIVPCVEGETLRQRLARGPVSAEELDCWMPQLLQALQFAHELGVVHRDLRPEIIWIVDGRRVLISGFGESTLDFGVQAGSPPGGLPLPHYVSPETLTGRSFSPVCDLWSVGAILYELLSGRPPFSADDFMAVLLKILSEDPAPLPADAPTRWATLAMSLLQRPPEQRQANAVSPTSAHLAALIDGLQQEGHVEGPGQWTLEPARALRQLQQFGMEEPFEAVLCAANAAGCAQLEIRRTWKAVVCTFHDWRLPKSELEGLWSSALLPSQHGRPASYLGRALAGLLNGRCRNLTVSSGGWEFSLQTLQLPQLRRARPGPVTLHLAYGLPPREQIAERFRYGRTTVLWCDRVPFGGELSPNQPEIQMDGQALALHVDLLASPEWRAVVDGRSFRLASAPGRVVVWGKLAVDLSGSHLVQNDALVLLKKQLAERLPQVLDEVLESQPFSTELRTVWRWVQDHCRDQNAVSRLLRREPVLRAEQPDWARLCHIAAEFDDPQTGLDWQLRAWLDWNLSSPTAEQREQLLTDVRSRALDLGPWAERMS